MGQREAGHSITGCGHHQAAALLGDIGIADFRSCIELAGLWQRSATFCRKLLQQDKVVR
jgi:hypothetical protein